MLERILNKKFHIGWVFAVLGTAIVVLLKILISLV
jgi:hypothetical protein